MRLFITLISILLLFCFSQCIEDTGNSQVSKNKAEASEKFKVRDHSLLYFRNMRLPFYEIDEIKKNKEFVYRIQARTKNPNYPIIHNAIHYDQRNSRAYLLLEPNRFFDEDSIRIGWSDPVSGNSDEFLIRTDSHHNVERASRKIAEYLAAEYDLYLKKGAGELKIFTKKNDSKQFLTVVNDFINFTSP